MRVLNLSRRFLIFRSKMRNTVLSASESSNMFIFCYFLSLMASGHRHFVGYGRAGRVEL